MAGCDYSSNAMMDDGFGDTVTGHNMYKSGSQCSGRMGQNYGGYGRMGQSNGNFEVSHGGYSAGFHRGNGGHGRLMYGSTGAGISSSSCGGASAFGGSIEYGYGRLTYGSSDAGFSDSS